VLESLGFLSDSESDLQNETIPEKIKYGNYLVKEICQSARRLLKYP
jgi:hypothetical protein